MFTRIPRAPFLAFSILSFLIPVILSGACGGASNAAPGADGGVAAPSRDASASAVLDSAAPVGPADATDGGMVLPLDATAPDADANGIPGWDLANWSCPGETGVNQCLKEWLADPTGGDGDAGFANSGFLAVVNGQTILEWYNPQAGPSFQQTWASASKTMVAVLLGIAQQEGTIDFDTSVSTYLNPSGDTPWSSSPAQESAVTLRHLMTQTSGFDKTSSAATNGAGHSCTNDDDEPQCLQYYGPPGTQFRYNTGLYGLLRQILAVTTSGGKCSPSSAIADKDACFEAYFMAKLGSVIGMQGHWVASPATPTELHYVGTAQDAATFGGLLANGGQWNGVPLVNATFFGEMTNTNPFAVASKYANDSYGYLTWLAGKADGLTPASNPWATPPRLDWVPGPTFAPAPSDAIMAIGSGGQYIHVSHHGSTGTPRASLVVVRLGSSPDGADTGQNDLIVTLWQKMNRILCDNPPTSTMSCP